MIPLLAFVIVQSSVPRIASTIYYMQYYRLARMVEGSVYSFVVTTMKTACEFLKDDPLSLNDASSVNSTLSAAFSSSTVLSPHASYLRTRSTSFGSTSNSKLNSSKPNSAPPHHINSTSAPQKRFSVNHRKSQSADLYGMIDLSISGNPSPLEQQVFSDHDLNDEDDEDEEDRFSNNTATSSSSVASSRRNSAIIRPHIVLPNPRNNNSSGTTTAENRKSLDIPNDWLSPNHLSSSSNRYKMIPSRNLGLSRPMVSTTFPSISNSTPLPMDIIEPTTSSSNEIPKLGRSLSASTVVKNKLPPKVINIRDRISFDGIKRPASICIDTRSLHSIEDGEEESEELMGDFLRGLSKLDGNVVGERTGSFKTFRRFQESFFFFFFFLFFFSLCAFA
jgi:hypothetical protein